MTNGYAERQRERDELRTMTDRLVAEFAGVAGADAVVRCVDRCRERMLRTGVRRGLVPATEAAARMLLADTRAVHA